MFLRQTNPDEATAHRGRLSLGHAPVRNSFATGSRYIRPLADAERLCEGAIAAPLITIGESRKSRGNLITPS